MRVTHKKRNRCQYACGSHLKKGVPQTCHSISATEVDQLVCDKVLQALDPAALQLSLRAAADVDRERQRLHSHRQRGLDQARYEEAGQWAARMIRALVVRRPRQRLEMLREFHSATTAEKVDLIRNYRG